MQNTKKRFCSRSKYGDVCKGYLQKFSSPFACYLSSSVGSCWSASCGAAKDDIFGLAFSGI